MKYAAIAGLALALLFGGGAAYFWVRATDLSAENDTLTARVDGCTARIGNILKDKLDDQEIEDRFRTGDFTLPPRWLLPEAGGD